MRKLWWPKIVGSSASSRDSVQASSMTATTPAWHETSEGTAHSATHRPGVGERTRDGTRLSSRWARCQATSIETHLNHSSRRQRRHSIRPPCLLPPARSQAVLFLHLCIFAATISSIAAQTTTTAWCNSDNIPEDPKTEICLEPSVGPIAGSVMVTVKGMQRAAEKQPFALPDWRGKCNEASWWRCTFATPEGTRASPVRVLASSCAHNYVVCESPGQRISGDVFMTVSRNDSLYTFPSPSGNKEIFSYYGTVPSFPTMHAVSIGYYVC
jgi:hypothetical protein